METKEVSESVKLLPPLVYPRRQTFLRHIEAQMNSTKEDDRPKLIIAEPIEYLLEPLRESNPFTRIKANRISVLKEDLNKRRDAESQRFRQERDPAKKLPIELRQRYTAHAKVRELVKEEDHQELEQYGQLFKATKLQNKAPVLRKSWALGPSKLVTSLPDFLTNEAQNADPTKVQARNDLRSLKNTDRSITMDIFPPSTRSIDMKGYGTSRASSVTMPTDSDQRNRVSEVGKFAASAEKPNPLDRTEKPKDATNRSLISRGERQDTQSNSKVSDFMQSRRRVCLLELAVRTNENEIRRIDNIINAEYEYLKSEESELRQRHDEHDRYLKSICQRTAEAIRLAEAEAHKRVEVSERIKRARYKLAHLNAGFVKLEEEFLRLSTYRDFLFRVARKYYENRVNIESNQALCLLEESETLTLEANGTPNESRSVVTTLDESPDNEEENKNNPQMGKISSQASEEVNNTICSTLKDSAEVSTNKSPKTTSQKMLHIPTIYPACDQKFSGSDDEAFEEAHFQNFFKSPQDLVDILAELESNNLTLIENVQEQEEMCERVRVKASRLARVLNHERESVNEQISREHDTIRSLQAGVDSINASKSALNEFVLLDRYSRIFHLGGLAQFDWLSNSGVLQSTHSGSAAASNTPTIASSNVPIGVETGKQAAGQKNTSPAPAITTGSGGSQASGVGGGGGTASGPGADNAGSAGGGGLENLDTNAADNNLVVEQPTGLLPVGQSPGPSSIPFFYTVDGEERPTVSLLLSLLHSQIQRIYFSVYGGLEGGTKLDTLVMLRRLEASVDELCEKLESYPRNLVLRAKKAVDERNRIASRRKQKEIYQYAHEKRLQKAIQKAKEPLRWRFGRRIMYRSEPPIQKKEANVTCKQNESEEDEKSLFQP